MDVKAIPEKPSPVKNFISYFGMDVRTINLRPQTQAATRYRKKTNTQQDGFKYNKMMSASNLHDNIYSSNAFTSEERKAIYPSSEEERERFLEGR
jgi:hypothetical protein